MSPWIHNVPMLAVVLAALTIQGEPPPAPVLAIEGKDEVDACTLAKYTAKNVAKDGAMRWRISPMKGVVRADTPNHLYQFTAPPGEYRLELLVVSMVDGKVILDEAVKDVRVGKAPSAPVPPTKDIRDAIGRVRFGSAGCTATLVGPRRVDGRWDLLCAAHCVTAIGQSGSVTLKDGRVLALSVVARDAVGDLSWLATESPDIESLPHAVLAAVAPPVGTPVSHSGYGVDRPANTENGTVATVPNAMGMIGFDLNVSSGDSGGAIYRRDTQEIVGAVCCTSRVGGFARMYGGGCVRAGNLRPRGNVSEAFDWVPLQMPLCPPHSPAHLPALP